MAKTLNLLTILLFSFNLSALNENWKYFGQNPPGETPVVFAPGIVSTKKLEHSSPVFTSDLKEVYWAAVAYPPAENTKTIYCSKYKNGKWSKSEIAPFSGEFADDSPFCYNDKIFFSSNRGLDELPDSLKNLHWTLKPDSRIWFCEKRNIKWSEPKIFSVPLEEKIKIMAPNFTNYGNLCFMSHLDGVEQQCGIYLTKKINKKSLMPIPLPVPINSRYQDWTPFIAPDESYIIFSSTRNQNRKDYGDLYISFKIDERNWSEAIYMGDSINTPAQERFPSVSPDGKYLFFTRWTKENGQDVFWVSASIIEKLKIKLNIRL